MLVSSCQVRLTTTRRIDMPSITEYLPNLPEMFAKSVYTKKRPTEIKRKHLRKLQKNARKVNRGSFCRHAGSSLRKGRK